MNKLILNVTKLFIIHAKENNILELDLNDLRENFYQFKNMEKYQEILYSYQYNEDNICIKLEKEIRNLAFDNQISLHKRSIYIYNIDTSSKKHFDEKINSLIEQMVHDYIKLNMTKTKTKMG